METEAILCEKEVQVSLLDTLLLKVVLDSQEGLDIKEALRGQYSQDNFFRPYWINPRNTKTLR